METQMLCGPRPEWAKALIVAELVEDQSDSQTDYFGHRTARTIGLAWSRHSRDLFPEMRKAAATFGETAHLGPGRDRYTVRVVIAADAPIYDNGSAYYDGQASPWHHDEERTFDTAAEAAAHVADAPALGALQVGESFVAFRIETQVESYEHREKWSMGGGYYLAAGSRHSSGWQVRKVTYRLADYAGDAASAESQKERPCQT